MGTKRWARRKTIGWCYRCMRRVSPTELSVLYKMGISKERSGSSNRCWAQSHGEVLRMGESTNLAVAIASTVLVA